MSPDQRSARVFGALGVAVLGLALACNDASDDAAGGDAGQPAGAPEAAGAGGAPATMEPVVEQFRCQGSVLQVSTQPGRWVTEQLCASAECCQADPPVCRLPRFGCPGPEVPVSGADAGG